jgi:hypothetical protein
MTVPNAHLLEGVGALACCGPALRAWGAAGGEGEAAFGVVSLGAKLAFIVAFTLEHAGRAAPVPCSQ